MFVVYLLKIRKKEKEIRELKIYCLNYENLKIDVIWLCLIVLL